MRFLAQRSLNLFFQAEQQTKYFILIFAPMTNTFGIPVKELVAEYLINIPASRDDRMTLLSMMWQDECSLLGIETLDNFFEAMTQHKLMNAETIRRVARKLQAEHPELAASPEALAKHQKLENVIRANKGEIPNQ